MCSPLSNQQAVTADFILVSPPTCKRWAWGIFFREWGLHASNVKSSENPFGNTSCDSPADGCLPINQVTLVSSSHLPSERTAYSSSCCRLSWYAKLCTYKYTTNTLRISHYSLLLIIPKLYKVDVRQVQIQVAVNVWAMWCALQLAWNGVSDVMLCVGERRVKGAVNMTRDTSECGRVSQVALLGLVSDGGASLTLVSHWGFGGPDIYATHQTTLFIHSLCNLYLHFQSSPALKTFLLCTDQSFSDQS